MQHSSRTSGDVDTAAGSGGVRSLVSDNQTVAFFVVTLLLSWAAWLVAYVATGGDMGQLHLIPGAFGPMVAAVLVTWASGGSVLLAMLCHASVNTAGGLLPVGEAMVEQTPVLLDAGMIVGVWIAAIALVVWQDPATLSQRELPGSRRPGTRAETTPPG